MDSNLVEELTSRLPTSELVKIIKGALECGRRNVPFTETDLLRVVAFGAVVRGVKAPKSQGVEGGRRKTGNPLEAPDLAEAQRERKNASLLFPGPLDP